MNYHRLLAVWHYCEAWHAGQDSREYRLLGRLPILPRGRDEYLASLAHPDYTDVRDIYVGLVRAQQGPGSSGYVACVCCDSPIVVDDTKAEDGVTMCAECEEDDHVPTDGCPFHDDDEPDQLSEAEYEGKV